MPVQIPGQARPYDVVGAEAFSPQNILQAQGMQQQNALRNIAVQQGQQEVAGVNALRNALSQPGAIDQQTGQLSPGAMQNVLAADPKLYTSIIQQQEQMRLRQMQEENYRSLIDYRKKEAAKIDEKMVQDMLGPEHEIVDKQDSVYDAAVKAGVPPDEARQMAVKAGTDMVGAMANSAVLGHPDIVDKFRIGATKYDPIQSRVVAQMEKGMMKQKAAKPIEAKWVDDKGIVYGPDPTGEGAVSFYNTMEGDKGWRPLQGKAPTLYPIGQTPAAVGGKATATAEAKAAVPVTGYGANYDQLTPQQQSVVDYYSTLQWGGDSTWRTGLSRAAGGSNLIKAVDERVPSMGQELGLTAADAGTNKAIRIASQSALTQNTKDLATLKPYVSMLDQNADILKGLATKAIATNSAYANRTLNWIRANASDNPDLAEYLAQVEIVKNEATRVISNPRLVGQMTDSARQEIESIINGNMPLNATSRVLDRIKNDGERRITTLETQQKSLQDNIKKMFPGGQGSSAPAASSGVQEISSKEQYDALPPGSTYRKPGDPADAHRVKP